jgi:TolA-binding protein
VKQRTVSVLLTTFVCVCCSHYFPPISSGSNNKCYKFETKTSMEQASVEDLQRATAQGTILAVKVDGVMYGSGAAVEGGVPSGAALVGLLGVALACLAVAGIAVSAFLAKKRAGRKRTSSGPLSSLVARFTRRHRQVMALPANLKETIFDGSGSSSTVVVGGGDDSESDSDAEGLEEIRREVQRKAAELERTQSQLDRLQDILDQEKILRHLERCRHGDRIAELERALAATQAAPAAARMIPPNDNTNPAGTGPTSIPPPTALVIVDEEEEEDERYTDAVSEQPPFPPNSNIDGDEVVVGVNDGDNNLDEDDGRSDEDSDGGGNGNGGTLC